MVASPEVVQHVIDTFREAARLTRATPTLRGNVVELTPDVGDEVLISADLHGNRRNFNRLLAMAQLRESPRRHLVMQEVCHGGPTYPAGGGCMSHTMLEDVAQLKVDFPQQFHFLISNHELAELTDFPIIKAKRMLNLSFRCGLSEMYGCAADEVRAASLEFLGSLPLAVRISGGVLVCHSIPAEVDKLGFDAEVLHRPLQREDYTEGGAVFRTVWGRDFRQENVDAFAKAVGAEVFVTGHEPCRHGYQVPNSRQVIIDCCGETARYALLPIGNRPLSQSEVLGCVAPLFDANADMA